MRAPALNVPPGLPFPTLRQQILDYAQSDPRHEVCGLVGAKRGQPCSFYPVENVAATPATRFLMAPQGQIEAMRTMRERAEDLYGIFHSHPDGSGAPSETDRCLAAYPGVVYYIAAIRDGVAVLYGWNFDGEGFTPLAAALP